MRAFWTKLVGALAATAATAAIAALAGCAATNAAMGGNTSQAAQAGAAWDYGPDGVILDLVADPALNMYAGQSHTVLLGVYQLPDAAPFRQKMTDPAAAAQTLDSGTPDADVISLARYVIVPGKRAIIKLDRAQNAKYVGISVGYFRADARTMRVFKVPLAVDKKGWVSSTYKAAPAVLMLQLRLGVDGIIEAKAVDFDAARQSALEKASAEATVPLRLPVAEPQSPPPTPQR